MDLFDSKKKSVEEPKVQHVPVLLKEVIETLKPEKGKLFVDATFGLGGHSAELLKYPVKVIGIDRDSEILKKAVEENQNFVSMVSSGQLNLVHSKFSKMQNVLKEYKGKIDGILFDIGISSVQIDVADRGFSYRELNDAKLDMRMDRTENVPTAFEIVNNLPEFQLAYIIYTYGEEKKSRYIARAIVNQRQQKKIETTWQLSKIIDKAISSPSQQLISDHTKRTFQAIRIFVNKELEELKLGLDASEILLKPGGILTVLTYHSLEDRIVKNFFNEKSGKPKENYDFVPEDSIREYAEKKLGFGKVPQSFDDKFSNSNIISKQTPTFYNISKKVITASKEEVIINKRSKSAKLRTGIRV